MQHETQLRLIKHLGEMASRGELSGLAVFVADLGGHSLFAWRCPSIGFFYSRLSEAKAWTSSALLRTPTATRQSLDDYPSKAGYLSGIGQGTFAPIDGSVLCLDQDGEPVCGLGIAGPAGGKSDLSMAESVASAVNLIVHHPK